MVSGEKAWDPHSAGLLQSRVNSDRRPAAGLPPHIATSSEDLRWSPGSTTPSSSPLPTVAVPALCDPARTPSLCPPAEQPEMKGRSRPCVRGEASSLEEDVMADEPKNAKITLSFPLGSAPLPASLASASGRCRSSSSSSPSPHRRRGSSSGSKGSDEGSLWKLDATMDVKHRPFKPPRRDSSPSSSSSPSSTSSPMTVSALARRDIKSPPPPPPLKCPRLSPEAHFGRFPPARSSGGSAGACFPEGGWEDRHRSPTGSALPSQAAQILFSQGGPAYHAPPPPRGRDAERKEKPGRPPGGSKPGGPNLPPPALHLPPPPPPPPSSPPQLHHPPAFAPSALGGLKPELICGVCHRIFSSASSLTAHMRLHRGNRALSCRYCSKAFIHSKRLQSHEASCGGGPGLLGGPPRPLPVRPKEEPLEEGEVRVEGGVIVEAAGGTGGKAPRPGKKARSLLARIQASPDDAAAAELLAGDENHFVKVVDGNVIYFCSVCERSYMTLSSLKRHSNVHSWRRKYPCHFCDKVFALAEYRTKHEVWHTGERRYQCIFCWDAFATYYNLKTHQKTIHGINPGLISSEKTANGGYKQKVNGLKLYRLLPMRSQKRPYKTYSDGLPNGLLLPPPDGPALPLTLGLESGDLQSLVAGGGTVAHRPPSSLKPDPDAFPDGFPISAAATERGDLPALAPPLSHSDVAQGRRKDREGLDGEQGRGRGGFRVSGSSKAKSQKSGGGGADTSSVITYGHANPSVIVHAAALSSSVIVHSNQVAAAGNNGKSPLSCCPSPESGDGQASYRARPGANRKRRGSTERHRKRSRDSSDTAEEGSRGRQDTQTGRSRHKSRKLHGKAAATGDDVLSPASLALGSQVKGAGPLCQITVRIGEEAIVKRSISETDLRRDKSRSPPKGRRAEAAAAPSPRDVKEPRPPHAHHHKNRAHHRAEEEEEEEEGEEEEEEQEGETRRKTTKAPDEVREYYFRREVREQGDSDHDAEDNLWRPYYSYKPKRKAQAHLQRAKNWQRKLQYKRSLRLMRKTERLVNHAEKDAQLEEEEPARREAELEEVGGAKAEGVKAEKKKKEQEEKEEEEGEVKEDPARLPKKQRSDAAKEPPPPPPPTPPAPPAPPAAPPPPTPVTSSSSAPGGVKRRPWTSGNAAECGTCGRWFSSIRKRDKHELSHLLEFVCMFCRATFPSRDKLEDHQKSQHPRPSDAPSLAPKDRGEGVGARAAEADKEEGRERGPTGQLPSPGCLSRRALARHTCPQCHKVCKTPSALTRHVRRHELSSSPEREREEARSDGKVVEEARLDGKVVEEAAGDKTRVPEEEQAPPAQSVSVISYSAPEPAGGGGDSSEAQQSHDDKQSHDNKQSRDDKQSRDAGGGRLPALGPPVPERAPSPRRTQPTPDHPVRLTPPKPVAAPTATPSTLESVLVMSEPECLDYRTAPRKKPLNEPQLSHRIPSPARVLAPPNTSPNLPVTSQTRIAVPPVSLATANTPATAAAAAFAKREGVIMDRERHRGSGMYTHVGYGEEPPLVHDLRTTSTSRSPSPTEAQDLSMSSILAREREVERQRGREREIERQREREVERQMERERERERRRERERELERGRERSQESLPQQEGGVALLVPKEEPLSPAPSPQLVPTPIPSNGPPPSPRHAPKSPPRRRSPTALELLSHVSRLSHHSMAGSAPGDRPSAHALLLPRAPRDGQQGALAGPGYPPPVQDLPVPLVVPSGGGYRSGKKQEESLLVSHYPAGPFGPLGKVMVPGGGGGGELAKLPFYHDPYQLLYGPQLLAYPYNLAALPVALNMMAPGGDKVEPLPFLPAIFNYAAAAAAAAGPYMGAAAAAAAAARPLVANPGLYGGGGGGSSGGNGKKQRDSGGGKP